MHFQATFCFLRLQEDTLYSIYRCFPISKERPHTRTGRATRFAQEEEVQVPEEVEEVREEGTFEEEAWEGDYQAEEYVEASGRHWEASRAANFETLIQIRGVLLK